MPFMKIERAGLFSQIQDLGRTGHQKIGVSVNGPMDECSHRLANAIVGNADDCAVLECTFSGPRAAFTEDAVVALCGARMQVTIDGRRVPLNCALYVRRGAVLDIGRRIDGARIYLAVRGGFATPRVLGSRSTNSRAGFGGYDGRILRAGDEVPVADARRGDAPLRLEKYGVQSGLPFVAARPVAAVPPAAPEGRVRFIAGPQWAAFTQDAQADFVSRRYLVSPQSDRMGLRLKGEALTLQRPLEIVSEATVFGTVQVPPDGLPIVLMADRQSSGGYPKIGYVAGADLPRLAQLQPNDTLGFQPISQAEAETLWRAFVRKLAAAREAAALALSANPLPHGPAA